MHRVLISVIFLFALITVMNNTIHWFVDLLCLTHSRDWKVDYSLQFRMILRFTQNVNSRSFSTICWSKTQIIFERTPSQRKPDVGSDLWISFRAISSRQVQQAPVSQWLLQSHP